MPPGYQEEAAELPPKSRRKADSQEEPKQASVPFQDATNMVTILVSLVEGMIVPALGEEARFKPNERKLIDPSLGRMLARMSPDSAAAFSALADPILLGTGLLLWGLRVFGSNRKDGVSSPRTVYPTAEPNQQTPSQSSPTPGPISSSHPTTTNGTGPMPAPPPDDLRAAWGQM